MKKILLLILLVMFTITLTAQAPKGMVKIEYKEAAQVAAVKTNEEYAEKIAYLLQPTIAPEILTAYESIIFRGKQHNKNIPAIMLAKGLISITVVDSLPEGLAGRNIPVTSTTFKIVILKDILKDFNVLENVLAHEIGHGAGLEHVTEKGEWSAEIMAASVFTNPRHLVHQVMIHNDHAPGIWERFFDQL